MKTVLAPSDNLFVVKRTSFWGTEDIQCDEVELRKIRSVDIRTVDDPKKIPCNNGTDGDWYIKGENHRVENGQICRDLGWEYKWFAEDLNIIEFVKKYGSCVVSIDNGYQTIEIYDDYRE